MKTNKENEFSAVKMMRDIRNKIDSETSDMSLQELKAYMQVRLKSSGLKPIGQQ